MRSRELSELHKWKYFSNESNDERNNELTICEMGYLNQPYFVLHPKISDEN